MNLVTNLFIRWRGSNIKKAKAIRKADKLHQETGKQYRVFFLGMRYRVLTRDDIQRLKHEKLFARHINSTNIDHLSFYNTGDQPCLSVKKN